MSGTIHLLPHTPSRYLGDKNTEMALLHFSGKERVFDGFGWETWGKETTWKPSRRLEDDINPLTPNNSYSGRTAPLTSKCYILYIYSTNAGTEYFKHGTYSPFFPLKNAVCFIILTYLIPVLFTFYIQMC